MVMVVRVTRYLVALLCVLIGGYLVILPFTAHHPAAHSIAKEGGSRIRLTAVTPDGSAPNHDTASAGHKEILPHELMGSRSPRRRSSSRATA